jgi:hypothetical protein
MTAAEVKLDRAILSVYSDWQAPSNRNRRTKVNLDDLLREASMRVSLESLSRKCPLTTTLLIGNLNIIRYELGRKLSCEVGGIMMLPAVEARKSLLVPISKKGPSDTDPMCQYAPEGKRFPPNRTLK